jgi:cellulose biosynthesis protein BcsQ
LLDLDLQGSLTGFFVDRVAQRQLQEEKRLLTDFLFRAYDAQFPHLRDYIQPALTVSGIVPTTDTLAYAENNLMVRWLLRVGKRDPRFLLRRELHLRGMAKQYDVVLLDCPPLVSISCVNALAASDYLLIPVLPSKQVTDRVPVLLKRVREIRDSVNPDLKVLGVVANRVFKGPLTDEEGFRLAELAVDCKTAWDEEIYFFHAAIRQSIDVRAAEDERRPVRTSDKAFNQFLDLAHEIRGRLPAVGFTSREST